MTTKPRLNWRTLGVPVYVVIALLIVFALILIAEFASLDSTAEATAEPLSATSYRARVAELLANAQPEAAEAALVKYGCTACHREGAANGIAPSWVDMGYRAATRRPPLPADAYIYESIVHPSVYVVEGYSDSMPQNFGDRLSDQELGDIIAYLLAPDAK